MSLRDDVAEAIEEVRDFSDDCAGIEASEKYADAAIAAMRERLARDIAALYDDGVRGFVEGADAWNAALDEVLALVRGGGAA